jgi:hypothetical protein
MDPRLFVLPDTAQLVVRDAIRVLHTAQRSLAAKKDIASRARHYAERAAVRATRFGAQKTITVAWSRPGTANAHLP